VNPENVREICVPNQALRSLLSEALAEGGRAVLVFCETDAAEAFRILEGLGEEWEVIEGATDITELLGVCGATGMQYVGLDPPTALARGDAEEEPRLVPLKAFVDHLLDDQEGS
jgi:hypothetical protein